MRLQKIRIKNFRSIHDLEMDLEPTTVLVGPNNAGKTAILAALRIALSRRWGQQGTGFTEYDFRREAESADPKKSDPIVITAVFGEDQEDEWPESVADILFDVTNLNPETGLRSVILEVSFQFADLKDDFEVKTHFLDPNGFAKTGTAGRSVNFQSFFKVIRVFSLAALRDVITEFRPKSRFWGSLIRNTEIPEGKWQDIGESLKGINADILDSAELLGKVRDKIQSINEIVSAGAASDVDLRAVPMNEWDLLSRAEVVIKGDKSDPWLPLSLHGQGVQSLSVIYLFQAYVEDVLKKEGVEPFPILLLVDLSPAFRSIRDVGFPFRLAP